MYLFMFSHKAACQTLLRTFFEVYKDMAEILVVLEISFTWLEDLLCGTISYSRACLILHSFLGWQCLLFGSSDSSAGFLSWKVCSWYWSCLCLPNHVVHCCESSVCISPPHSYLVGIIIVASLLPILQWLFCNLDFSMVCTEVKQRTPTVITKEWLFALLQAVHCFPDT